MAERSARGLEGIVSAVAAACPSASTMAADPCLLLPTSGTVLGLLSVFLDAEEAAVDGLSSRSEGFQKLMGVV